MGVYKDGFRLNLVQCVCTSYMGSWTLSSTSIIMNSWHDVPTNYISVWSPSNAENDETKPKQKVHKLAWKQVRYSFTKNPTYISYGV